MIALSYCDVCGVVFPINTLATLTTCDEVQNSMTVCVSCLRDAIASVREQDNAFRRQIAQLDKDLRASGLPTEWHCDGWQEI